MTPTAANLQPWSPKNWGKTRRLLQDEGVEVWEAFAQGRHRTSFHCHPQHRQIVWILSGTIEIVTNSLRVIVPDDAPISLDARIPHELRFVTDCHFVEIYRGPGDVMDSIQRIFQ